MTKLKHQNSSIVFITGPTASGKSDLAMCVAQEFGGELICADSQTVRRGMNIGTAKPSAADQSAVPHHLLDIIDPYERFSVAQFVELAEQAITDIVSRKKMPIVVGGTGLYIDALLYGFSMRPTNSEYTRPELEAMTVEQLQEIIRTKKYVMPENDRNPRHLIRTIESEGAAPSKGALREGAVVIGIDPGKEILEQRIAERSKQMIAAGLVDEVDRLLNTYGAPPNGAFEGVEYRVVQECRNADGSYEPKVLAERLLIGDRQYAKKQRAWLKRSADIQWFDTAEHAFEYLSNTLSSG